MYGPPHGEIDFTEWFWEEGEWIHLASPIDDDFDWEGDSELERLEVEAELQREFPNGRVKLWRYYARLLKLAKDYHDQTGSHLQVYGDIGELYGAVVHGIHLNSNYTRGADGKLGNDHIEIKTITPFKAKDEVTVWLDGHFNKLLVVKITKDFSVTGRMIARKNLPVKKGMKWVKVQWQDLV
jgi:hypothetical protein